jgi:hypothetical protein
MVGVVGSKPIAPTNFSPVQPAGKVNPRHALRNLRVCVAVILVMAVPVASAQMLAPLGPLDDGIVTYFIAEPVEAAEARPEDRDLAVWALEAWQRAAGGALKFVPAASESDALVRLYWVPASGGQYGEMRPLELAGRRGAAVYIRPDTAALGPDIAERAGLDALFRDTIVYLTCVHELGHALGLTHTANFADIMYFFGFGGDIDEFFGRYRRTLGKRADIAGSSGLSAGDLEQLRALYAGVPRQVTAAN